MPETLFISDLHLDRERPEILSLFVDFLATRATDADALYILGDLFEYWIGDDDPPGPLGPALDGLRQLTSRGVPVYFMHGNRDFLIGDGFVSRTGVQLLDDPTVIDLYGIPTLLMHGDSLCIDDVGYQALREQLRNEEWQAEFLARPLETRRAYAQDLRDRSRAATAEKAETIMDVNRREVIDTMRMHGVARLIHGHTHRPAVHPFELGDRPAERIVLGDWYDQGSALVVTPEGYALTTLPRPA